MLGRSRVVLGRPEEKGREDEKIAVQKKLEHTQYRYF
jgi:hypothetical protein